MYDSSAPIIQATLASMDILMIIMARLLGFTIILPGLSGRSFPLISRIGFTFIISTMLYVSNYTTFYNVNTYTNTFIGFGMLLFLEFIVGFTIGFTIYMFFTIVFFSGQIIDYNIGFSMVSVTNPLTQTQAPVTGNFFYFIIVVFFIQTGAIHLVIDTLFDSYKIVPIGTSNIMSSGNTPYLIIKSMTKYFELGLRIALPITGVIMIVNIALGILVKANPQMNIFVVGMPVKLLIGLVLLLFFIPMLVDMFTLIFDEAYNLMKVIIRTM